MDTNKCVQAAFVATMIVAAIWPTAANADPGYNVGGPVQIIQVKRNAVPLYVGVRRVYTNGVASTVSGALVTNYNWGNSSTNARVFVKH